MHDLWSLCSEGKRITEKVVVWKLKSGIFALARRAGHPAFEEASELSALRAVVHVCRVLSGDIDHVAVRFHRPFNEWLERERMKVNTEALDG